MIRASNQQQPSRAAALLVLAGLAGLVVSACAAALDLHEVEYSATDASLAEADGDRDSVGDAPPFETSKPDAAGTDASACGVHADGKLYCTNRLDTVLRSQPTLTAPIVDTLRSTASIFLCWGVGEPHAGGNSTWYYTNGDDNLELGWAPAVSLGTSDAIDANPSAFGLARCKP